MPAARTPQSCAASAYAAGPPTTYPLDDAAMVATGDVNCDGLDDIVVAGGNSGSTFSVLVFPSKGDGTFPAQGAKYDIPDPNTMASPNSLALGDIDGDGTLDIIVEGGIDGLLSYFPNQGDGTFGAPVTPQFQSGDNQSLLAAGDLDGNGTTDLVVVGQPGLSFHVLLNSGRGQFAGDVTYQLPGGGVGLALVDLDGDHRPDLVIDSDLTAYVYLNDGHGGFAGTPTTVPAPPASESGAEYTSRLAVADFDGDGTLDLAMTSYDASVSIVPGHGDGTFGTAKTYAVANPASTPYVEAIGAADLNGDGHPDLVLSDDSNSVVYVTFNNGDGTFGAFSRIAAGRLPRQLAIGDFRGDHVRGVAVVQPYANNICNGSLFVLSGACQ